MNPPPNAPMPASTDGRRPIRRIVLDTNVIVAALLHPGRTPDRAIERFLALGGSILVDPAIVEEYRDVLDRRKFERIPRERRDALLARLLAVGVAVDATPYLPSMIDADDRRFVEVALGGAADAIVTGNGRHFPTELAFEVLSPAEWLARLDTQDHGG